MKELKHLNKYFYKYRGRLFAGLFITAIATVFRIVVPAKIGDSVDAIRANFDGEISMEALKHQLFINILLILGAALLSGFFYVFDAPNHHCHFKIHRIRFEE